MYGTCNRYVIWDYILLCPKLQLLLLLLPVHNDSITITITITKYPVIVTITITITYYYYPSPALETIFGISIVTIDYKLNSPYALFV